MVVREDHSPATRTRPHKIDPGERSTGDVEPSFPDARMELVDRSLGRIPEIMDRDGQVGVRMDDLQRARDALPEKARAQRLVSARRDGPRAAERSRNDVSRQVEGDLRDVGITLPVLQVME